ncbi:MAG: phage protein GemA/Gp16 family protein, partial [Pseudomonadota bacterium]
IRAAIFAACRELGLDSATRHELQRRVTGCGSLTDMTENQKKAVLAELRNRGALNNHRAPRAPRRDQRKVYKLWWILAEAGAVAPGKPALARFLSNPRFAEKWGEALTRPELLSAERCQDAIEALKDIARREGVELEQ